MEKFAQTETGQKLRDAVPEELKDKIVSTVGDDKWSDLAHHYVSLLDRQSAADGAKVGISLANASVLRATDLVRLLKDTSASAAEKAMRKIQMHRQGEQLEGQGARKKKVRSRDRGSEGEQKEQNVDDGGLQDEFASDGTGLASSSVAEENCNRRSRMLNKALTVLGMVEELRESERSQQLGKNTAAAAVELAGDLASKHLDKHVLYTAQSLLASEGSKQYNGEGRELVSDGFKFWRELVESEEAQTFMGTGLATMNKWKRYYLVSDDGKKVVQKVSLFFLIICTCTTTEMRICSDQLLVFVWSPAVHACSWAFVNA